MSLPRLGCGDPSQKCQDGTKCSDDHNGDHRSVLEEAVCEQDPYPDPAALADQQDSPSSGHAEAAVVHALFSPQPEDDTDAGSQKDHPRPQHVTTVEDFYDDPEFDSQVLQALETAAVPTTGEQFQAGAVPGFAVKRSSDSHDPVAKRIRSQQKEAMPTSPGNVKENLARVNHEPTPEAPIPGSALAEQIGEATSKTATGSRASKSGTAASHHGSDTDDNSPISQVHGKPLPRLGCGGFPVVPHDTNSEIGCATRSNPPARQSEHPKYDSIMIQVVTPAELPFSISTDPNMTVADLVQASVNSEQAHQCTVSTAMGRSVDQLGQLQKDQMYVLDLCQVVTQSENEVNPPILQGITRGQALWQQLGWVARDEMEYYLYMLECYSPGTTYGILDLPESIDNPAVFTDFILKAIREAGTDQDTNVRTCAIRHRHHWFPVVVAVKGPDIHIHTAPMQQEFVSSMLEAGLGRQALHVMTKPMPKAFPADCGFQTVGWLLSVLLDEDTSVPFTATQALQWRKLFHKDLISTGAVDKILLTPLPLAGMQSQRDQLQALVTAHGVAPTRGKECAEQLTQALGTQAIGQILTSPRPWADLKSRASLHQPPIRVVLADELKALIQRKAGESKAIGKKANKLKNKPAQRVPLQLRSEQLTVPNAVFRQADGEELGQIDSSNIKPGCKGVAIVNIAEVLPYFSLSEPLSPHGAALLILEHEDGRLPAQHKVLKVPVQCRDTQDPMIIKVAMVQLGQQEVSRNMPAQAIAVPEVPNQVVRVVVYQDQFAGQWQEFVKSPVKCLLQMDPFRNVQQAEIIDVWDRQFMSTRMSKTAPEEAAMFSVNLRINEQICDELFQANGTQGIYLEPRSPDGRNPHDQFKVVWLPGKSFGEAQVSQKTSKVPTMLVRQADRYGLRVDSTKAEELHRLHRPDLVYIPGVDLVKYRVGPMPFGSTKQSLIHVFSKWQWKARPLAPQGQAKDRSGVMWLVQASEPPSHWIFQLSHGDVLISPEEKTQQGYDPPSTVLASSKTIQALQASQPSMPTEDPWLHHDPWQSTRPTREIPTGQIASLETRIEQTVLAKVKQADVSTTNQAEDRVSALEAKVEQLGQVVAANQHEMAAQHQQVQSQLCSLDQKVDAQQGVFQTTLEAKLEQQMQRIEQLFSKRQRTNE